MTWRRPDAPSAPPGRSAASRMVEVALLGVARVGLGCLLLLVGLADLATVRLAQWAVVTGTRLPASLGSRWALVADADGVRLTSASRTAVLAELLAHRPSLVLEPVAGTGGTS